MLEGLLHHKKEETDYICALIISEDTVDAALWESNKEGKIKVLKVTSENYQGELDQVIDAADRAITTIEEGLADGAELKKVVFGLFPEWLEDDRIKDTYLKKLKQLTKSLSLTPLGFVELPQAVVHLLAKDEGTQQTVILAGIETKHLTVSLYKIGKLVGSITSERSDNISSDVEAALASFKDVEVLPSRVLLYGTIAELEKIKSELLNYPWQKKANFLHFPKIEVLARDFPIKAVAIASNTEITPHTPEVGPPEDVLHAEATQEDAGSEEVAVIAKDLGFVTDKDIALEKDVPEVEVDETVQNVAPVAVPTPQPITDRPPAKRFQMPKLPQISLPKLTFSFRLPRFNNLALIIAVVLVFLLIGASATFAYWTLPKATVKLLVKPQVLDKSEKITVAVSGQKSDEGGKVLPGKEVQTEITGSNTIKTTGKKTVGDKAKGDVTIYNKTQNPKTFKAGTTITSGSLKFTLDQEVSVASASEGVGSLTYGTIKAAVTAGDIGTASNLAAGAEFSFTDLPTTSYSARNDQVFAGGSSREVSTVSREDQASVRKQVVADLENKAETELAKKMGVQEKLLDGSIESKVVKETFSKEIGEEAEEVTLEVELSISALSYNETDFFNLLDTAVAASIPQNYEYKKEDAQISVEEISKSDDGNYLITSHLILNLLPKVETGDLSQRLAGRSITEATEVLRSLPVISGVEFDIDAPLASLKNKLPANPGNIKILISPL